MFRGRLFDRFVKAVIPLDYWLFFRSSDHSVPRSRTFFSDPLRCPYPPADRYSPFDNLKKCSCPVDYIQWLYLNGEYRRTRRWMIAAWSIATIGHTNKHRGPLPGWVVNILFTLQTAVKNSGWHCARLARHYGNLRTNTAIF